MAERHRRFTEARQLGASYLQLQNYLASECVIILAVKLVEEFPLVHSPARQGLN